MHHFVYILTDSNRKHLHVGMADNLSRAVAAYRALTTLFSQTDATVPRLVYREAHPSETAALARFHELSRYTRMQKERLIRRYNPNWVNLSRATLLATNRRSRTVAG